MFKKLLSNADLTQETLAKELNVSQALISKWVRNKCQPSIQMLPLIAKTLKVDVITVLACFVDVTVSGEAC